MIDAVISAVHAGMSAIGNLSLAYRPFIDPLKMDDYWLLLLLPLVLVISLTYKTIKIDDLSKLAGQTLFLAAQIVIFMVLAAAALWVMGALV